MEKGLFYRRDDGSVWIDLTADGLDQKLLLRGRRHVGLHDAGPRHGLPPFRGQSARRHDLRGGQRAELPLPGIETACSRSWAMPTGAIISTHLSYGMVELPEGKMKSREGTVVDADDLIEGMVSHGHARCRQRAGQAGRTARRRRRTPFPAMVGLGALKYFILKVDPQEDDAVRSPQSRSTSTATRGLSSSIPMRASARCCARPPRRASTSAERRARRITCPKRSAS